MHGANEMHGIVVLLIVLFLCVVFPFKFKCPPESQWRTRAKAKCGARSEKQYSCLYDENANTYVESCNREIDYVAAGQKYVIIGLPTDRKCNQDRYQPTKFWINSNNHCVYLKSLCNELGQRFLPSESAREDVNCRCDHTLGYAFVTTPANLCYCKPEKEDCSCYSKQCGDNGILLSDYECMSENHSEEKSKCRSLVGLSGKKHETTSTREPPTTDSGVFEATDVEGLTDFRTNCKIYMLVTLLLVITVAAAIYRTRFCMEKKDLKAIQIVKFPCKDYLSESSDTIIKGKTSENISFGQKEDNAEVQTSFDEQCEINGTDKKLFKHGKAVYEDQKKICEHLILNGPSNEKAEKVSTGKAIARKRTLSTRKAISRKRTFSTRKAISRKRTLSTGNAISRKRTLSTGNAISRTRTLSTGNAISRKRTLSTGKSICRTRTLSTGKSICRTRTLSTEKSICRTRTLSTGKSICRTRTYIDKEETYEKQIDELQYDDNMKKSSDDIYVMMTAENAYKRRKFM